jgi:4-hydroxyphenylacetate 3-monooxygenase
MLKSGEAHLEGLRDGRTVYVGGERVGDVTSHPAFRNAARTVAGLYDLKRREDMRDTLSFEEEGERFSMHFLLPRNREDLLRRTRAHKAIADATHGLFGRSFDHVASFVAGMALQADVLDSGTSRRVPYGENLRRYYRDLRRADSYVAYAVVPAPGVRDPSFGGSRERDRSPTVRVVAEDDAGVIISGMKLLATGAVFADELWLGNVQPLAPERKKEAITCVLPMGAAGLSLWSRKPFEPLAVSEFDNPLTYRYDESDSVVVFDEVKVPWERIFSHDDPQLSRELYFRTPSHCFGNHQSNVRYWAKLQLLVGLASRIAQTNSAERIPAVHEALGRLAALEGMLAGMIYGQSLDLEDLGNGYVCFNRRYMYGALTWCTENYAEICDKVRELMGAGVFLMPADASVMQDKALSETFEEMWSTANHTALERMKLFKLAWDLLGSELATRHQQYEKFFAGPPYIVRDHSFREAPWPKFHKIVDDLMASYGLPGAKLRPEVAGGRR